MSRKPFGLLLAAGLLTLAACGPEEQPSATEEPEAAVEEKEEAPEEKATADAATEKAEEEPAAEAAPEAKSGAASELLAKGDAATFVFNQAGEFVIFCEPHPVMKMNVVVEEGAAQTEEVALDIADYAFSEETITVAPGTAIVWTNQDSAQHNVAIE